MRLELASNQKTLRGCLRGSEADTMTARRTLRQTEQEGALGHTVPDPLEHSVNLPSAPGIHCLSGINSDIIQANDGKAFLILNKLHGLLHDDTSLLH